jgi:lysophospholipase L1-like esterase
MFSRPVAGLGLLVAQVLRAAHREDLPSLQNQDPSGWFGDPGLPPLRLVVLGDSSVTAPGVEPLDDAFARRLARHLSDRHHVELISVAVGGAKVSDVLRDQLAPALVLEPDLAIVSAGANDALRATPVADFERDYATILSHLVDNVAMVGVSGLGDLGMVPRLPTPIRAYVSIRARSFDNAIRRVVARFPGVYKTRTWGEFWTPFATMPEAAFAPDMFHASGVGHSLFAASMFPIVDALLNDRDGA